MSPATREAERWTVAVGQGASEAAFEPCGEARGGTALLLAHGAGSHMEHPATLSLSALLRGCGLDVVRFDFLYRRAGRKRPDPMPQLVACYQAVAQEARRRLEPARLLLSGRSMGGRVGSVLAADGFACDGLVLLAYPLHPPGRPGQLRDEHLGRIAAPVLCLNGTRDDFCRRELMEQVLTGLPRSFTMHWLEGADHGFHVLKQSGRSDQEVLDEIARVTRSWLETALPP